MTVKQAGNARLSDSDADPRTQLDSGESVEAYIRRKLPTIDDRVEAYRRVVGKAKESRMASYYQAWQEEAEREAKRTQLMNRVWTFLLASGGLLIVGRQHLNVLTILLTLMVSAIAVWWFTREDEDEQLRHVKHLSGMYDDHQATLERDVELLRTGWVPNTLSGLSLLGLDPSADPNPKPPSPTTHTDYQAYLRSSHWKRTRAEALRRAGYRCQLDASHTSRLEVHHNTYERLGQERPEDLIVLCAECHRRFHANGHMPGH